MQTLQERIKEACESAGEDFASFRNDYSGRGMYGHRCVGVVGTLRECQQIVGQVIKNMSSTLVAVAMRDNNDRLSDTEYEFEEAVDKLMDFSMDSMGMSGVILYWPELEPIPAEKEIG